jgi:hypothetical protein
MQQTPVEWLTATRLRAFVCRCNPDGGGLSGNDPPVSRPRWRLGSISGERISRQSERVLPTAGRIAPTRAGLSCDAHGAAANVW